MKKTLKRIIGILLSTALVVGLMPVMTLTVYAAITYVENVPYMEAYWDGATQSVVYTEKTAASCIKIDQDSHDSTQFTFTDGGWYVVNDNQTFTCWGPYDGKFYVPAGCTANIILCDGASAALFNGIVVENGATLNIYGQEQGTGELVIDQYTHRWNNPAIGGCTQLNNSITTDGKMGTLNIHGGTFRLINEGGPVIGGHNEEGGTVNIYGGTLNVDGQNGGSAAIGGATGKSGGTVTIYGGTVNAINDGVSGAGIGGGNGGNGGTVTIYGGNVTAKGSQRIPNDYGWSCGAGIGGGGSGGTRNAGGSGGTVTIHGGTVTATGGAYGAGIGGADGGAGGSVTITGGTVIASSKGGGAGIGGGYNGVGANVTIVGGTVTATGGEKIKSANANAAVGIGAGENNTSLSNGELNYGGEAISISDDNETWRNYDDSTGNMAKYIKTEPVPCSVNLTGGANATPDPGTGISQTGLIVPMTPVTYTAESGYYFPEGSEYYTTTDGITVDRTSDTVVTVTGKPLRDTVITIPNAIPFPATAPTIGTQPQDLALTYGYSSGSLNVVATAAENHNLSYQWYSNTSNSNSDGTLIDGATSESYNISTGKNAGTTEYYYCVVTATRTDNNATATATSNVATLTVDKVDADELDEATARENITIAYDNETVTPKNGYEVSINGTDVATSPAGLSEVLDGEGTPKIYVRRAEDENHNAGAWVEVTLEARHAAPTELATTNTSYSTSSDGKITGTDATMEYSSDGNTWTDVSGISVNNLSVGDYYVRVKATNSAPHGMATTVTISNGYVALTEANKPTITFTTGNPSHPQIGDTLKADTPATGVIYQWYRGDDPIEGATDDTYTLTTDDLDKDITVRATQPNKDDGTPYPESEAPAFPSEPTNAVEKKTPSEISEQTAKDNITITYEEETVTPVEGYDVSTDGTNMATPPVSLSEVLDGEGTPKIYVRTSERDDTAPGEWIPIELTARPDAPTNLTTKKATDNITQDGEIIGTNDEMEYSADDGETWEDAGNDKTLVTPGTYLVRKKATNTSPAGKTTSVVVGNELKDALTSVISIADEYLETIEENDDYNAVETALGDAIDTAKVTEESLTATADDVSNAIATLNLALNTAKYDIYKIDKIKEVDELKQESDSTQSSTLITLAKTTIENRTYNENGSLDQNKSAIDGIIEELKDSLAVQRLTDAKTSAKNELATYRNSINDSLYDDAGVAALNDAKTAGDREIENATTIEAVATALETAKNNIDAVKTKDQKAVASVETEINSLPDSTTINPENAETYKDTINKAKKDYDDLTDDQENLVSPEAKQKLTDAKNALDLALAKKTALITLNAYRDAKEDSLYDDSGVTALNNAKSDGDTEINNATTIAGVEAALQEATDNINAVDTKSQKDAKAALEADYNTKKNSGAYDQKGLQELEEAYNAAIAAIDAATVSDTETDPKDNGAWKAEKAGETSLGTVKTKAQKDQEAADAVKNMINNLPPIEEITEDDFDVVKAAKDAFEGLTDAQKELIDSDTKNKLGDAITALADEIADAEKADDVEDIINGLPETGKITPDDEDDIKAAREAYEALTDNQKKKVDSDTLKKLENAEKALELAKAKEEAKDELSDYRDSIDENQYDEDGLKELDKAKTAGEKAIENATTQEELEKALNDAKKALDDVKTKEEKDKEAADAVSKEISKLPENGKVAATDKDAIEKARKAYDALTDDQKKNVPKDALKKLTDAEAAIKATPKETFTTTKASDEKTKDAKISGLDPSKKYQYSSDGGKTWKDVTGVKELDVMPGTYLLRYAGDNNSAPGAYVEVTVEAEDKQEKTVDMYRLYNPNSGEHFYTASAGEKDFLVSVGWSYEGVGWKAPEKSNTPVYRVYNPNAGDHHYTTNKAEKDFLVSVGWNDEGIGWYSDDTQSLPIYRQYNPNAVSGAHNFTSSKGENDWLVSLGWSEEGIGWYGVK